MQVSLAELQTSLCQLITTRDGLKRIGDDCDSTSGDTGVSVRGDSRLSAIDRVNIYANAYFYRLLDCLHEEFPATFAVVGANCFEVLVREYLPACPPTEPSIFYAGRHLHGFLRKHPLVERWPFISDLAKLERSVLDVFHAAEASALSSEAMRAIPSQQWSRIGLKTHPAVEIVRNQWRVTDILGAVENGREWRGPAHRKSTVIVWRQHAKVHYRDLEDVEAKALALLSEGARFADICEVIAALATRTEHVALIGRLLAQWLADGIIMRSDAMPTTSPTTL
jgi:hypothetical protein